MPAVQRRRSWRRSPAAGSRSCSDCRRRRASHSSPAPRWRTSRAWPPHATPCWPDAAGMSPAGASRVRRAPASSPTSTGMARARPRILATIARQGAVDRAWRLLGFGSDAIEALPVDAAGQVTRDTLAATLARSDDGAIVVLQAGELNLAAFDPFEQLAPVARRAGAWTHVDAAFGLWARVSPAHRHRAAGIEMCDSWTPH